MNRDILKIILVNLFLGDFYIILLCLCYILVTFGIRSDFHTSICAILMGIAYILHLLCLPIVYNHLEKHSKFENVKKFIVFLKQNKIIKTIVLGLEFLFLLFFVFCSINDNYEKLFMISLYVAFVSIISAYAFLFLWWSLVDLFKFLTQKRIKKHD